MQTRIHLATCIVTFAMYAAAAAAERRAMPEPTEKPVAMATVDNDQEKDDRVTSPVAVFPVRVSASANTQRMPEDLRILTAQDGAVVSVTVPPGEAAGTEGVLVGLVLDLGPTPDNRGKGLAPLVALKFSMPSSVEHYNAVLDIEGSDDLSRWEWLIEGPVYWLYNGQPESVWKDRIELPPRTYRYARIRWIAGDPMQFAGIRAERTSGPVLGLHDGAWPGQLVRSGSDEPPGAAVATPAGFSPPGQRTEPSAGAVQPPYVRRQ